MKKAGKFNRILIFGGAFDPPHRGHIELPQKVAEQCHLGHVLYLVSGHPPHKDEQGMSAATHRVNMLELALEPYENVMICTLELSHKKTSYTVDSLRQLRKDFKRQANFRLLIGADQAIKFDTWKDPEEILKLAPPLVMVRPPMTRDELADQLPSILKDAMPLDELLVEIDPLDVSSSQLREAADAKDEAYLSEWLSEEVRRYIEANELYR